MCVPSGLCVQRGSSGTEGCVWAVARVPLHVSSSVCAVNPVLEQESVCEPSESSQRASVCVRMCLTVSEGGCLMSQREIVSQSGPECVRVRETQSPPVLGRVALGFVCSICQRLPEAAPPRPQLFIYNINADHLGSTHKGPNCRLQL